MMMRKFSLFFILLFAFFVVSCKVKKNSNVNNSVIIINDTVFDSLPVFLFDGGALFDTLSEDNIIESIRYIPLSSEREAMMPNSLIVRKLADKFIVMDCNYPLGRQPKIFDLNGKYIKDAFNIGRGPNELLQIISFTANESSKKAYFFSFDKIITIDMVDMSLTNNRMPLKEDNLTPFWCALNDGMLVTHTTSPLKGFETNEYPFMYVFDGCFKKVGEHFYNYKRDLYQNTIPDVTAFPCENWNISSSPSGGTFKDMYSDTIYSVLNKGILKPEYLIYRGEKYMPTIEEVNYPANRKFNKIYYQYIIENDQYVILHYVDQSKGYVNIWNKKSGVLLSHQTMSSKYYYPVNFSFGEFHGELWIDYITAENLIYSIIPAKDLMGVIPDLKEDDNPVIVEIKLKDNAYFKQIK